MFLRLDSLRSRSPTADAVLCRAS